jgi:hypothetical protein
MPAATNTPTVVVPTSTPTSIPVASDTPSVIPSTSTPLPVAATNTSLPSPALPCNQAAAGDPLDVSVADGTRFSPGESFVKTWRITNSGSCTWTEQYALVWVSGEQMGAPSQVSWSGDISPGGMLEVSVGMVAPTTAGSYQSGWMLRSASGERFGLGANGETPLTVRIEVAGGATAMPVVTTGSIGGRVVLNGAPAVGVNLTLEDQGYTTIASAQVGAEGTFTFIDLPAYANGYNLVFSQEANPQFGIDQVVSWSWAGPIPLSGGSNVTLPDFEIGLIGFSPLNPAPDSIYSVSFIYPGSPLLFDWLGLPGMTRYWVDLYQGEEQALVWKSGLVTGPPVAFEGALLGGAPIQPGDYWWAVGAQKPFGDYTQTVYSYLVGFGLEP